MMRSGRWYVPAWVPCIFASYVWLATSAAVDAQRRSPQRELDNGVEPSAPPDSAMIGQQESAIAAENVSPFLTPEQLAASLARYAFEPTIEAVLRAALQATPAIDVAAVASRARAAGWVPRIALRARRGQALDLANAQDEDTLRVKSNDDLTLEATVSFELDRLVFRSEETALVRQQRAELDARAQTVRQIIHLYYERRRLQVERDLDPEPVVARSVRIAEISALLDAFTGGAFQRMIEQGRWTTGAKANGPRSRSQPRSNAQGTP